MTEDIARNNLKRNVQYIMDKNGLETKKEMAAALGVSLPTLSNIFKTGQIPNVFPFFVNCKSRFGYDIDDLLYRELWNDPESRSLPALPQDEKKRRKYMGLFMMYHFKTGEVKGREDTPDEEELRCGVMLVTPGQGNPARPDVIATFSLKRSVAEELYATFETVIKETDAEETARRCAETIKERDLFLYEGNMTLIDEHILYQLHFADKDYVTMCFHRARDEVNYYGGLGGMLSIGSARYHNRPCLQNIGMVCGCLSCSGELIARQLRIPASGIRLFDSGEKLCDMLTELYRREESSAGAGLTDQEKRLLVRHHVEFVIQEVAEKNLLRVASVAVEDDYDFCHFLRKALKTAAPEPG